ncbi:glycosyltransferase family 2 protein [Micropruina sp.]|uniref:glycosyltransferase family 2 protein n=1 Tax=Micropruina sp. TaxID=2737536 RepID=UPI0039E4786D
MSLASIVIPAHNEASVLPATLDRIARESIAAEVEVVVVANACTDDTAEVARGFASRLPRLSVIETDTPGKANALNLGDRATTAFPRIFLDADILLGPGALPGMVDLLSVDAPLVGSPVIRFDLTGADRWVRAYYRVFEQQPYLTDGLVGLGVYGISARGRERFMEFPDLMADDLYIQRLFEPSERLRTRGEFIVRTPRKWSDLVRVRTRVERGNAQIAAAADTLESGHDYGRTSVSSSRSLIETLATQPTMIPSALVYTGTVLTAKARAKVCGDHWGRDESSRIMDGSHSGATRIAAHAQAPGHDRVACLASQSTPSSNAGSMASLG